MGSELRIEDMADPPDPQADWMRKRDSDVLRKVYPAHQVDHALRELQARREAMEEIQQILDSRMPSGDRQALIEVTMKQIQKQYPTEGER